MNISGIGKAINRTIGNGINKCVKWAPAAKFLENGPKDPASFAAKMMVISLISKDAVNCVIYTAQSANNERIPKDKRGFNAWLDAINGILNVGGQMISYFIVDSIFTPKWFGKAFSGTFKDPHSRKTFDLADKYGNGSKSKSRLLPDNIEGTINDTIDMFLGKSDGKNTANKKLVNRVKEKLETIKIGDKSLKEVLVNISKEDPTGIDIDMIKKQIKESVVKEFKENSSKYKSIEKGFALLVGALATTALVKRTLVPLIATPLAGNLSDWQEHRHKNPKNRLDYEISAVASGKYNNQIDKTVFKQMSQSLDKTA